MKHRTLLVSLASVFVTALLTFQLTFSLITADYNRKFTALQAQYSAFFKDNGYARFAAVAGLFDRYSVYDLASAGLDADTLIALYMQSVKDPYAEYFNEQEYAEYLAGLNGSFVGIGIQASYIPEEGVLQVLYPMPGSPAEAAGLQTGDRITAIGELSVAELGHSGTLSAIRGEEGTTVTLTVERAGSSFTVTVARAAITSQTVTGKILTGDDRVGYIRITGFEANTSAQFIETAEALIAKGAKALIFDLRDNGGGLLSAVCEMLAWLLPDGPIAHIENGDGSEYTITGEGKQIYYGVLSSKFEGGSHRLQLPVVVLTNGNTASAAELFTAALRDYATPAFGSALDVTVVGTETFGKGVMQTSYVLADGSALKLTVAYYNPPSDVNYDGVGITPALRVTLDGAPSQNSFLLTEATDPQLIAARDHLSGILNK